MKYLFCIKIAHDNNNHHFFLDIKSGEKHQWKVISLSSIVFSYYKCHKINPNGGGLCVDSLDWIKTMQQ